MIEMQDRRFQIGAIGKTNKLNISAPSTNFSSVESKRCLHVVQILLRKKRCEMGFQKNLQRS